MKKLLLLVLSVFTISACGEDTKSTVEINKKVVKTKEDFAKYVGEGISYSVNEKGVLIFENAKDMFNDFNDYPVDEGMTGFVKIINEKPLSLKIHKIVSDSKLEPLKEYSEMSFLYAIYRTFMNTPIEEITVEAYPMLELDNGKMKALSQYTLKTTVNREKALSVLKKYSPATSFNDLIQTEENNEHRQIGISGSKLWDKFIYNEKERSNIVADLVKE